MGNSATVCKMSEGDADIALIGLAVMGQNLILNMNDHGFKVVAYNRTTAKVDDFLKNEAKGTNVVGAHSLEEMVAKLKRPRRVMILVKAGAAVDAFIDKLVPLLEKGDIIIDGGNSEYQDSQRRTKALQDQGILFVGSGVSGGEEGARYGPSLMPGGNPAAWPAIKPIFQEMPADASRHQDGVLRRSVPSLGRSPAVTGSARTAVDTSSRWCTMGSSMETCSSSVRLTTS